MRLLQSFLRSRCGCHSVIQKCSRPTRTHWDFQQSHTLQSGRRYSHTLSVNSLLSPATCSPFGQLHSAQLKTTPTCNHDVRVRFAPSPTGQLHLGGLRTAMYNYLFARSQNGTFVLRIEDTDQSRLVPGAVEALIDMLQWVGITIDEGSSQGGIYGPYVQSSRLSLYNEQLRTLLDNGTAYHCFCTTHRLNLLRKEALARGETPKYDNRCRHLSPDDVAAKLEAKTPSVVRFKLETHKEPWRDLVYGPISYDVASIEGDPILMKSDGYPTYHFANVVDDHFMQISHVLRGVEWQVSTTKHILLYKAFGWQPPSFAHLPLLTNKDGKKLSKRQNDVHVEQYKNLGYFPDAVLNLLTTMGSGFTVRDTAGMNLHELIAHFDLTKLNVNSTRVDFDKLKDFNRLHMQRQLTDAGRTSHLVAHVRQLVRQHFAGRNVTLNELSDEHIRRVLNTTKGRICLVTDLLKPEYEFAWLQPNVIADFSDIGVNVDTAVDMLSVTIDSLMKIDSCQFTHDEVSASLTGCIYSQGDFYKEYMKILRKALGGPVEGSTVVDIVVVLGKDSVLKQLKNTLANISNNK